jgi:hypothetical protein
MNYHIMQHYNFQEELLNKDLKLLIYLLIQLEIQINIKIFLELIYKNINK